MSDSVFQAPKVINRVAWTDAHYGEMSVELTDQGVRVLVGGEVMLAEDMISLEAALARKIASAPESES